MRRRDFITLVGGAAAAWSCAARAQQTTKLPTIGFVGAGTPSTYARWVAAFVKRLRELGRIEGSNIGIEYRWAEGRSERYSEIATDFVRLKVDVIIAVGTSAAIAVKQATSLVPIVFVGLSDPIGSGLVGSLARPGGNVTGLSGQVVDAAGKRLDLLREIILSLRRLAVVGNLDSPGSVLEMNEVHSAARALGIEVIIPEIRRSEDIAPAFKALEGRVDAIYVASDPLFNSNRVRINALALSLRLPTQHTFREYVEAGGLMSYGPNFTDLFQRAAEIADKILRGVQPSEIPVEQPTKFELVINLKTAKALGVTIPPTLLAQADEVIE